MATDPSKNPKVALANFSRHAAGPNYTYKSPEIDNRSFSNAPIPAPSTLALVLLGLSTFALRRFRKM